MAIKASALDKNGIPIGFDCYIIGSPLPVVSIPFSQMNVVGEFWAVPVKDGGIVRGWKYTTTSGNPTAPTPDSFKSTKIEDRLNGDTFVVAADRAAIEGAADGATIAPNPQPVPVPENYSCINSAGQYVWMFDIPAKQGSQEYKPYVMLNNTQAVQPPAAGFATNALMVTWLNANYAAAGTWANPSGQQLTLTSATNKSVGVTITVGDYA